MRLWRGLVTSGIPYDIVGEVPLVRSSRAGTVPRFGFTGLQLVGNDLLAGAWRGLYRLDAKTLEVKNFITNRYTSYLHRFYADKNEIIFIVPQKDMLVRMGHDGAVRDVLTIDRSLLVEQCDKNSRRDWRFINKMLPGGSGFFHFNHVQKIGSDIYLTSRHLGSFVVLSPGGRRASLRTINYCTPSMVHDGDFFRRKFYFTSVDGKILIVSQPPKSSDNNYHYDLQCEVVRLGKKERNWCRGIKVTRDAIYTTVDGRYGTDLSFSVLALDWEYNKLWRRKLRWSTVGREKDLRYVTGFDIETLPGRE